MPKIPIFLFLRSCNLLIVYISFLTFTICAALYSIPHYFLYQTTLPFSLFCLQFSQIGPIPSIAMFISHFSHVHSHVSLMFKSSRIQSRMCRAQIPGQDEMDLRFRSFLVYRNFDFSPSIESIKTNNCLSLEIKVFFYKQ